MMNRMMKADTIFAARAAKGARVVCYEKKYQKRRFDILYDYSENITI